MIDAQNRGPNAEQLAGKGPISSEGTVADGSPNFPWRTLLLWNLLIVLYGMPLAGLALSLHELGHVLAYKLVGLQVYGIHIGLPARGGVVAETPATLTEGVICSLGGVVLECIVAVLVLAFSGRGRRPLGKLALLIFSGFALIHASIYLTSGYYCSFGDFRGFMEMFRHLRYLMPLMVLALPALGWLLAGWYLPLQEAWLPARTTPQRWKLSFCALGMICLLFSVASGWVRQAMEDARPAPYTFLVVSSFSLLLFAGGGLRIFQKRELFVKGAGALPLSFRTLVLPATLCLLFCLVLLLGWAQRWVAPASMAAATP